MKFTRINSNFDFTDDELLDSLIERIEVREFLASCQGGFIPNINCIKVELQRIKRQLKESQIETPN
jgi:hypothetical protein